MTTTTDLAEVTDADVEQAEQEAAEAAQLVHALEERVRDGDDTVTHDEIEHARSLGRFAQLRADATRRKADRAKAAAHAQALAQLRTEILDGISGGPSSAAAVHAALDGVDKAIAKFLTAADKHNLWHAGIRERIRDLCQVAPDATRGADEQSGIAYGDEARHGQDPAWIAAGDETIEEVSPGELLAAAVFQAARGQAGPRHPGLPIQGGFDSVESALRSTLTNADAWYAGKRERLAAMAAAAKARRSTR